MKYKIIIISVMLISKLSYAHEIGGGYVWQHTNDPIYKFRNGFLLDYSHSFKKLSLGLKWSETYANKREDVSGELLKTKISGITGYVLIKLFEIKDFKTYIGPNYGVSTFSSTSNNTRSNARSIIGATLSVNTPDFIFKGLYLKLTIEQKYNTRSFKEFGSWNALENTSSLTDFQIGLYYRINQSKH